MTPKTCADVYVFVSRGPSAIDNLIAFFTQPQGWALTDVPSHAGLIFRFDDGTANYAEAFVGEDWICDLNIKALQAYAAGPQQWVEVFRVPLADGAAAQRIYENAIAMIGCWHYSVPQLFRMLWHRLWGTKLVNTPTDVVCSEAVGRLLLPEWSRLLAQAGCGTVENMAPIDLLVAARAARLAVVPLWMLFPVSAP